MPFTVIQSRFLQNVNGNVNIRGLTTCKQKIQQLNVTPVKNELGPQPFGSDALLSEILRHVLLLGKSEFSIWTCCIGSN